MKVGLTAKFTFAFILIVCIVGIASTLVGIRLIADGIIKQAQNKVKSDLNAAREIYQDNLEDTKELVRLTALRFFVKDAMLKHDINRLRNELNRIRVNESLDILTLIDPKGRVIVRTRNPNIIGDEPQNEVIKQTFLYKQAEVSTLILTKKDLLKEGNDLAEQASIKMIATPRVHQTTGELETEGMTIIAAAPIFTDGDKLLGVLYGGKLINRNYSIVDKIKHVVFQAETYKGAEIGASTIFLGGVRVSTNVINNGERAIGTVVADKIYEQVFVKGGSYFDRAYAINNWYITAYEPIKDISGQNLGILAIGILEKKYVDMRRNAIITFLGIVILGIIVAIGVSHVLARNILKPLRTLAHASHQIAEGNLNYRINTTTKDELDELVTAYNFMAASLKDRDEQLKEYTRQQVMRSERLATLGQLAAGVAHEINNPLTGVLTYIRLIQKRLLKRSDRDDDFKRYLDKVEHETERCSSIVRNLLDFARQSEPNLKSVDVNLIINESLDLLAHKIRLQNVEVEKKFDRVPLIVADFSQLQQAFMNIIINATEAMENGGKLIITTRSINNAQAVELDFTDTGVGIPKANLTQIFEPFFTTKTKGTGLGLSVVYGIVSRHKGDIEIKSEVGKGTSIIIRLPVNS